MTDPRIAALEPIVKEALRADLATCGGNRWPNERFLAIFIVSNLPPDWCGHIGVEEAIAQGQRMLVASEAAADREITLLRAEIARLRTDLPDGDCGHGAFMASVMAEREQMLRDHEAEIARLRTDISCLTSERDEMIAVGIAQRAEIARLRTALGRSDNTIGDRDAEIARLRKIEEAARALLPETSEGPVCAICLALCGCMPDCPADALRAALEER